MVVGKVVCGWVEGWFMDSWGERVKGGFFGIGCVGGIGT